MKRVFLAAGVAFVVIPAQAGGVDINLSEQALRGVVSAPLEQWVAGTAGVLEVGVLTGDDEGRNFIQGHAGALVTGDAGAEHANVTAGLGGRIAVADSEAVAGGALALGGMFEGRLPAFNRLGVVAYLYGAPKASAFGDFEGYFEYAIGIDYQVLRQASVYAGYRQLKVDLEDVGDATVDSGWHLGMRLSF